MDPTILLSWSNNSKARSPYLVWTAACLCPMLAGCAGHDARVSDASGRLSLGCAVTAEDLNSDVVKSHIQNPGTATVRSVLKGAFDKPGPLEFVFSLKPNSRVPAHYHDGAEEVVIISGGVYMGDMSGFKSGGVMDTSVGMFHAPGGRHFVPARIIHWVFTNDTPAVGKVCSQGPFAIYFVERPQ